MTNFDELFNIVAIAAISIGTLLMILATIVLIKETWFKKK